MLKRIRKNYREKMESNGNPKNPEEKKHVSLQALKNLKIAYIPYNELLREGFFAGIGWAFGVTIGFVLISTLIVFVLRNLGGLPLIGAWLADIVEETQSQILRRTPVF
jgi:hypothetical protein